MPELPFPESLCHRCAAPPRYVRTGRSTFIKCPLVDEKYPRQPVLACPLFRPPIVTTERLWLREATAADVPFVATMTDSLYGMDAHEWLHKVLGRYARDGYALWLAVERESGAPVGAIGLLAQTIDGVVVPEVSYHLHAQHRRRGFAAEGALAVRDWAFGHGHDYVVSLILERNSSSQAVARKLGMTPRGHAMHAGEEHVVWRVDRR